MPKHELQRWREEKNLAYLYRVLSDLESGSQRQLLFLEFAASADEQADLWAREIRKAREMPPIGYTPDMRTRLIAWLVRRLGPQPMVALLKRMNLQGLSVYTGGVPEVRLTPGRVDVATGIHEHEPHYPEGLRTAVLGISDGLFSISLLVVAVAGATSESPTILLTGLAGLLSGAGLMAAGEWFSLSRQEEVAAKRRRSLQDGFGQYPPEETRALALIYQRRGMSQEEAYAEARRMIDDPELGMDILARERSGMIHVASMRPWQAAMLSFFAFLAGGLVPLLPYLLEIKRHPLLIAVFLTGVLLFVAGAATSLFKGRQALWGGVRMLLVAILAGAVCYWAGSFVGTNPG